MQCTLKNLENAAYALSQAPKEHEPGVTSHRNQEVALTFPNALRNFPKHTAWALSPAPTRREPGAKSSKNSTLRDNCLPCLLLAHCKQCS